MNDYDDFGFDDYSSGTECPMCCGSLVHDGICYECGADIDAARSAMGLDSYADHRLDTYLQSLQPRSATKTAADFLNETASKRQLTPHLLRLQAAASQGAPAPLPSLPAARLPHVRGVRLPPQGLNPTRPPQPTTHPRRPLRAPSHFTPPRAAPSRRAR